MRLLRRCLQKDPNERLRDIGDARLDVVEARDARGQPPSGTAPVDVRRQRLPWIVAVAAVAVAAITALAWTKVGPSGGHRSPQWLPDGRHFLFAVGGDPNARGVYVGAVTNPMLAGSSTLTMAGMRGAERSCSCVRPPCSRRRSIRRD
jgi:hypothetical protein